MKKLHNFFDDLASSWDSRSNKELDARIELILQKIEFSPQDKVLDVGAGTGVLIPYLRARGIKDICAVDFSIKMIEILKNKYPDVKTHHLNYEKSFFEKETFSKILIYNVFPHFNDNNKVFKLSYEYLTPNGQLIIAHSMNREELNDHHKKAGKEVESHMLPSDKEFTKLFKNSGFTNIEVTNKEFFFACGTKSK
jgi:ubiquinone/menaquinone biosynthesis C-methylase UbiE